MTQAMKLHGLSKLDLFTPNCLHPALPPLQVGQYMCMGSPAVMISEPDVLARKQYIHGLLGITPTNHTLLSRRRTSHSKLMIALDITFRDGRLVKANKDPPDNSSLDHLAKVLRKPKSLHTSEGREKYIRDQLAREWEMMGTTGQAGGYD